MKRSDRRVERGGATRAALLAVARELFAERGYAGVGTEEVVRRAEVTRGALYHHFRDKADLFRAVYEALEEDLTLSIVDRLAEVGDPWDLLVTGMRLWLDACQRPEVMQITLIDAPAVLGWESWREASERYGLALVSGGLEGAMSAGVLRRQPVEPLAHLMLGAMHEAGMLIARRRGAEETRNEVGEALLSLLRGLGS